VRSPLTAGDPVTVPGPDHAGEVRRRHAATVRANRLRAEDRWGRPCLAYLLCVRPGPAAAAALGRVQDAAQRLEPSLLRVPGQALHTSVLWLLPVHEEFGQPKDALWEQNGPGWVDTLATAADSTGRFPLRYRTLAATDSAVIAVADEPNPLTALRRALTPRLGLPGGTSAGALAHVTLFRYAGPLRDPAAFLDWLAATEADAVTEVTELLVTRERVFPALDCEVLHTLPLGGSGGVGEVLGAGGTSEARETGEV
jgi:hypothetical protein